jgi:hypothetical protein
MTNKLIISTKKYLLLLFLLIFPLVTVYPQVTIGSLSEPDESAILELKSGENNKGFLMPKVKLKDIYDQTTIKESAIGLIVFNTENSDPIEVAKESKRVKANHFYYWTGLRWIKIISRHHIKENLKQILADIGAPRPALYTLNGNDKIFPPYLDMKGIFNFMSNVNNNTSKNVPMTEVLNYTDSTVRFNQASSTLLLQPGIYKMTFAYEFIPILESDGADCEYSAYYMDFPQDTKEADGSIKKDTFRMYSASRHTYGWLCDHGGSFSYTAQILTPTEWKISLGRAPSECSRVRGFAMPNRSTFLYIFRLSDSNN